jgi:23S rRNA (pseudouridine1915-N3)-methyltransferase
LKHYRIIAVGKLSEPFYRQGVETYLTRLSAYGKFELTGGFERMAHGAAEADRQQALAKEAEQIHALLRPEEIAVGLDMQGKAYNSVQFAEFLRSLNDSPAKRVNFIVGSSLGLADSVKTRLDHMISFSALTFPHQLALLLLTEQLYRGFRILRGEPYHK